MKSRGECSDLPPIFGNLSGDLLYRIGMQERRQSILMRCLKIAQVALASRSDVMLRPASHLNTKEEMVENIYSQQGK